MKSSIASIVLFLFLFNINLPLNYFSVIKFQKLVIPENIPFSNDTFTNKTLHNIALSEVSEVQNKFLQTKSVASEKKIKKIVKKVITAYSSSPDETDETPFITASNTFVRDGIVATNSLPFGVKIMIPEIFGDKIFVVEDRMHPKYGNRIDIWMPSKKMALEFGKKFAEVYILDM